MLGHLNLEVDYLSRHRLESRREQVTSSDHESDLGKFWWIDLITLSAQSWNAQLNGYVFSLSLKQVTDEAHLTSSGS